MLGDIMMVLYAFILILLFGLKPARKARAFMWVAQIALGDAIALKKGVVVQRYLKKRVLRALTSPTR